MAGTIRKHVTEPGSPPMRAHPVMHLRNEIDRLFDGFRRSPWDMFGSGMGRMVPDVDVKETGAGFEISAELPGMDEKDVTVALRDGVLTISGEKKAEHKEDLADYHLAERTYGAFTRSFHLPPEADDDHMEAAFAKGVLTVTIPKRTEKARPEKKIEIKAH